MSLIDKKKQLNLLNFRRIFPVALLATLVCLVLICSFIYSQSLNDTFLFRRYKLNIQSSSKQQKNEEQNENNREEITQGIEKNMITYSRIISSDNKQRQNDSSSQQIEERGVILYEQKSQKYYYFDDYKIIEQLKGSAKFALSENNEMFKQLDIEKIKGVSQNYIQLKEFQYGNWCGPDYGGFESKCKDVCMQNENEPSDDCIKCRTPMNYLDSICMEHDFCQFRYQKKVKKEKSGFICAYRMLNVGQYFQTRCECTYFLQEKLSQNNLIEKCDFLDCIAYGLVIEKAFNNILFDCACYYNEYHRDVYTDKMYSMVTQKCVSPKECKSFGGS